MTFSSEFHKIGHVVKSGVEDLFGFNNYQNSGCIISVNSITFYEETSYSN